MFNSENSPCFIIAEVAQAHDGSLGLAHAYIDAISLTGADAVKFQTHIADAESTLNEPWRARFSLQDTNRYDYWKRMEFTEDQWHGLKKHAEDCGLKFLSSPFSIQAMDTLIKVGVFAWKVASGEINNTPMFERMIQTRLPILISTGMSPVEEIDTAVDQVKAHRLPFVVLQCTSMYPCPPEKVGLNMLPFFRDRYKCAVGLSDHSGTIYTGLAATSLNISVLEVHITLSREMFGPDVTSSLTTSELSELVRGVRIIEKMNANPVDKDILAQELTPLRKMFTKSIVASQDIPADTILTLEHLVLKKPGTGLPAHQLHEIVGRKLRRSINRDEILTWKDFREDQD